MTPSQMFVTIIEEFRTKTGVTLPSSDPRQRKGFGSSGLRFKARIFAMLSSDERLVVKLPRDRVDTLVASEEGERFDPRKNGQLMREWFVTNSKDQRTWLSLAEEAFEFASSPKKIV